jgi:TP901 family phage tail tape measure protein
MAMNEKIGDAFVEIGAKDKGFQKKLKQSESSFKKFGANMGKAAAKIALAAGAAAVTIATVSVKEFSKFEDKLSQSMSIMGDLSDKMKGELRDSALAMGAQFRMSSTDAAESLFFLASAGLSANESMLAMPVVAKFATAGMFDMATATDLLTDAQSALGLNLGTTEEKIAQMTKLSDVFVKANTLANTSVQQLSEALTNDAGTAMRGFGIDLEDGVATLAAYADQGIKGNVAGSMYGRMLRLLGKAARDNEKAFEDMKVAVMENGEFRDMADIMHDLEVAFKDLSTEEKGAKLELLGFETLSQKAILPLIGTSEAIRRYKEELKGAGGTTQDIVDKQLSSFPAQMDILKGRISNVAIKLGKELAPAALEMSEAFTKGIEKVGAFATKLLEGDAVGGFIDKLNELKEMTMNIFAVMKQGPQAQRRVMDAVGDVLVGAFQVGAKTVVDKLVEIGPVVGQLIAAGFSAASPFTGGDNKRAEKELEAEGVIEKKVRNFAFGRGVGVSESDMALIRERVKDHRAKVAQDILDEFNDSKGLKRTIIDPDANQSGRSQGKTEQELLDHGLDALAVLAEEGKAITDREKPTFVFPELPEGFKRMLADPTNVFPQRPENFVEHLDRSEFQSPFAQRSKDLGGVGQPMTPFAQRPEHLGGNGMTPFANVPASSAEAARAVAKSSESQAEEKRQGQGQGQEAQQRAKVVKAVVTAADLLSKIEKKIGPKDPVFSS